MLSDLLHLFYFSPSFLSSFLFLYICTIQIYVFGNLSALEISLMQYYYEMPLKTGICTEKWVFVRPRLWIYHLVGVTSASVCCLSKQQQANVATSFTDLWGTGGRLLLLLKQREKSGWSVTTAAQKCHLQLHFPRQWGMCLGRQGLWWGYTLEQVTERSTGNNLLKHHLTQSPGPGLSSRTNSRRLG